MRIAVVVATFPSPSETFIVREIEALERGGVGVTLCALRNDRAAVCHPSVRQRVAGVTWGTSWLSRRGLSDQCHWLFHHPGGYARAIFRLKLALWRHPLELLKALRHLPAAATFARRCERDGVQHIRAHFAYIPADMAAVMAALLDVPFSVSAHAWDIYTSTAVILRGRLRRAAFVTACTQDGLDRLTGLLPAMQDRITLMRHGVEPALYSPARGGRRILAVGRLVEKKGMDVLLNALAILRDRGVDCCCHIAGDGPCMDALRARTEACGLGERVVFKGMLDQETLMREYGEAAMVVAPSIVSRSGDRDGTPNVLLEAMAMELPVVASDLPGIRELVRDGVNGRLVTPGDSEELATVVAALLSDPGERDRLGRAGRQTIEEDYDVDRNIRVLPELLSRGVSAS